MTTVCKRTAIIIAAPGDDSDQYDFPVRYATESMVNYLVSDVGGRWNPSDVNVIWNAKIIQPEIWNQYNAINDTNCDYLYIHYIGHGYSENGHDFLHFGDKQSIPLSMLFKDKIRQCLVIDACRSVPIRRQAGLGDRFTPIWDMYNQSTQNIFEELILASPIGRVLIQSTKLGDNSWGDSMGPFFTQSLLHASFSYIQKPEGTVAATTGHIFSLASEDMKRAYNTSQTPTRSSNANNLLFPFTIAPI